MLKKVALGPSSSLMNSGDSLLNIIRFIKSQRLKWLSHVERMQKDREVTKIYKWKPFAS